MLSAKGRRSEKEQPHRRKPGAGGTEIPGEQFGEGGGARLYLSLLRQQVSLEAKGTAGHDTTEPIGGLHASCRDEKLGPEAWLETLAEETREGEGRGDVSSRQHQQGRGSERRHENGEELMRDRGG